jgi:hypothetical protein
MLEEELKSSRLKHHEHHTDDFKDDSLETACRGFIYEFFNLTKLIG